MADLRRFVQGLRMPVLAAVLAAWAWPAVAQPDEAVVARVEETLITAARFNRSYVQHLLATGRNDTPAERHAHLESLIDTYLLGAEARRRGLEDEAYRAFLERLLLREAGGRFYEVAFLDSLPDLTEAEIREAYRRGNEPIVARHLFFRTPEAAGAAYHALEAGADFLALANACFGTAAFDSAAGFLGQAGYWDLDDAVAEAAYALPVGAYARPVRSRYGWHVVRVEDRLRHPLLTEAAYQVRRDGVRAKARQRRMRLEGGRFVRRFMDELGVRVDPGGMAALRAAVAQALPEAPSTRPVLDEAEVRAVRNDLAPETVLAAYTFGGEARVFTARDYLRWLDELPPAEVRNRTAASVGRALRNEVLGLQGLARGLAEDPEVVEAVRHAADVYLAGRLQTALRDEGGAEPTPEELAAAFTRLGYRRLQRADADLWYVRFDTMEEAVAAKQAVAGGAAPDVYPAFASGAGQALEALGELGLHLRRAPLHVPVVIGTGDGDWYVAEVQARTLTYTTLDEVRDELRAKLAPFLPELRLLRSLREQADVEVDRDRFERMMDLRAVI